MFITELFTTGLFITGLFTTGLFTTGLFAAGEIWKDPRLNHFPDRNGYTIEGYKCSGVCQIPEDKLEHVGPHFLYCPSTDADSTKGRKVPDKYVCSMVGRASTGDSEHPDGFRCEEISFRVFQGEINDFNRWATSNMLCKKNRRFQILCGRLDDYPLYAGYRETTWMSLSSDIRKGRHTSVKACQETDPTLDFNQGIRLEKRPRQKEQWAWTTSAYQDFNSQYEYLPVETF